MKLPIRNHALFISLVAGFLCAPFLGNAVTLLDFEGIGDLKPIGDYYNGGPGGSLGVSFRDAGSVRDDDAGGSGDFGGEPSPDHTMYVMRQPAVMNVADGFDVGLSFYYSRPSVEFMADIYIYDALDGTGNLLAYLTLATTPDTGAPDPNGRLSPFIPCGIPFGGVARSVVFDVMAQNVQFDNVTLGTVFDPHPMPDAGGSLACLALGVAAWAGGRVRPRFSR